METGTINPNEFFRLSPEIQEQALMEMDLVSVSNLCDSFRDISDANSLQKFCGNANFWKKKCIANFPQAQCATSVELRKNNEDLDYWIDTYVSTYNEVLGQKLRQSIIEGNISEAKDQLEMGVSVDATDAQGNTALMFAAAGGNTDMLNLLLKYGADINFTNENGETAIFWSVWGFDPEELPSTTNTFRRLSLDTNLDLKNNNGVTIFDIIDDLGYERLYKVFDEQEEDRSMAPKVPDNVVDKELYVKIRNKVKNRVKVWPSAYASGQLVSEYKKAGGRYKGKKAKGDDAPLERWYKEKWVNVCKPKGRGYEKCGRKKSSMKNYPYCRPSVRVSDKTPKTVGELKKEKGQAGLDKICKKKQTSGTPRKGSPRRVEKA